MSSVLRGYGTSMLPHLGQVLYASDTWVTKMRERNIITILTKVFIVKTIGKTLKRSKKFKEESVYI